MINDLLEVDKPGAPPKCEPAIKQDDELARQLAAKELAAKQLAAKQLAAKQPSKPEIVPMNSKINIGLLPYAPKEQRVNDPQNPMGVTTVNVVPESIRNIPSQVKERFANIKRKEVAPKPQVWEFDKPNPWSRVILNSINEYPYEFHIRVRIPSLNDFNAWRQVVPNLDFDPRTGELIIPSKDEPSALALANLIVINFTGQMSLENILEKRLIQISVAKAKTHELVQTKFREQINENLYGKKPTNIENNFEKDLAKPNNSESPKVSSQVEKFDFQNDGFKDTFEHFSETSKDGQNEPLGYDGSDYSYL